MPNTPFALALLGVLLATTSSGAAGSAMATPAARDSAIVARDGQRDFDFELGTWSIEMKRLAHPLSGSNTWISPKGYTHIVQKVWGGDASLAQLANDTPTPHYDGLMLRMYEPKSHEWRIYWGSSKTGVLDAPLVGHFTNGRGEFFMHDTYDGKPIMVRLVYSDITPTSFRTESSFSADEGKTWEPNLVQTFTRT
ncbi:MAG: hypothetical protein ABI889_13685 [Gemmatimonadota bacterium]